ncbi:hypothetical protein SAMN05444001_11657 [Parabacteroides chinchillae]|uniref:Uncharacterized protein n=1 Tax=Parabacteroides chinchillae TaxID=871327 RepID=A0A8G2BY31_9BACT|nr:hypothetical protein SAMN05444001_11657 [Parabacteroides chinchillae]
MILLLSLSGLWIIGFYNIGVFRNGDNSLNALEINKQ